MPVSIIANSAAQVAQSAIKVRNEALATGANRLSSGLRVASAGDDAAALAVGTSLKIINSGLSTAALNASAGVSALQIADGALGEINNLLIRMQALATQASSGQLDNPTRTLVDGEFQQLKTEVNRIAQVTEFNGVKLLAGNRAFANTAASSLGAVGITNVRLDPAQITADRTLRFSYDTITESLTVTRLDGGTTQSQTLDITALIDGVAGVGQNIASGAALEVGFSSLGVTLTLGSNFVRTNNIAAASVLNDGPDITIAGGAYVPTTINVPQDVAGALNALVTGYNTTSGDLTLPITSTGANVQFGPLAGISYRVNGGALGASGAASANLLPGGPNTIEIYADLQPPAIGSSLVGTYTTTTVATTGTTSGTLVLGVGTGLVGSDYVNNNAATRLTYKIGIGITAGQDLLNVDIPAMSVVALGIDTMEISTAISADITIDAIKIALTTLNQGRATVGAQQLRLEQVSQNLGVVTQNNEAARSALLDADISKEISDYTQNQALLEAGVAMLSRANQLPNVLLDLLRNG
jgi:flagellin